MIENIIFLYYITCFFLYLQKVPFYFYVINWLDERVVRLVVNDTPTHCFSSKDLKDAATTAPHPKT